MGMKVAILTISDRSHQGLRPDDGGPALQEIVLQNRWEIKSTQIVPDERTQIRSILLHWTDRQPMDLILTTGGTGIGPRDVTPEATQDVLEKTLPGLVDLMRREGLNQTPFSPLSRGLAGVRGKTLIVNLPGNPEGARESLKTILTLLNHAHAMIQGKDHEPSSLIVSVEDPAFIMSSEKGSQLDSRFLGNDGI